MSQNVLSSLGQVAVNFGELSVVYLFVEQEKPYKPEINYNGEYHRSIMVVNWTLLILQLNYTVIWILHS